MFEKNVPQGVLIGVIPMKRNQYKSKTAVCPFYKKEDQQTIFCDGVVDNSSVHLAFGNHSDCKEHKVAKCRSNYMQCPVYKMLEVIFR